MKRIKVNKRKLNPDYLLPLSKSWAIRMIFLDMVYGEKTGYKVIRELSKKKNDLADDIQAALGSADSYLNSRRVYNVRNSGTICRFLIYLLEGTDYKLKKGKQLSKRNLGEKKNLRNKSLAELLKLGTSQFASAAILFGARPIKNLPEKCKLSVEAKKTYFQNKGRWIPKVDEIIKRQINHFLKGGKFVPRIAEDYCYARAFGFITRKEGEKKWPELKNHESNRLKVMEKALKNLNKKVNVHEDHRVAMAVALRQVFLELPINIDNQKCVFKSWPLFWKWLEQVR